MTEVLGESFLLDEIRNKCDENVAAVPVFVGGKAKGKIFDRAKAG
jgi:hypothetical protein